MFPGRQDEWHLFGRPCKAMTYEEVLEKIIEYFAELQRGQGSTITGSTRLSDSVLIDSLTTLRVVLFLETEFGLSLERADLDRIDTPDSIARLIVGRTICRT